MQTYICSLNSKNCHGRIQLVNVHVWLYDQNWHIAFPWTKVCISCMLLLHSVLRRTPRLIKTSARVCYVRNRYGRSNEAETCSCRLEFQWEKWFYRQVIDRALDALHSLCINSAKNRHVQQKLITNHIAWFFTNIYHAW